MPQPNPFPLNVTNKINSPQLLAWLAQFGDDKFARAEDFNQIFAALLYLYENMGGGSAGSQDLQQTLDIGNIADKSIIIRDDLIDKFIAVAKESKDVAIWSDRIIHTSNGESTTQLIFEPTLIGAGIQIRNLSGTMALLSDLAAIQEGIAWKQPVELNLITGVDDISPAVIGITSLTHQGVTLVNDSRVIVSGLANQTKNGIYRVNSALVTGSGGYTYYRLLRTSDANTTAELNNAVIGVTNGTFAGKTFRQSTINPVIGTSDIVFVDFGTAIASATNLVAGIMKQYTSTGINEDGTMTQKAITDALALKANKTTTQVILKNNFSPNTLTAGITIETIVDSYDLGVGFLAVGESLNLYAEICKNFGVNGTATSYFYLSKVPNSIAVTDSVKIATSISIASGSGTSFVQRIFHRKTTSILSGRLVGSAFVTTDATNINNVPQNIINDANLSDYRYLIVASTYSGTGAPNNMQTNIILTKNPVV